MWLTDTCWFQKIKEMFEKVFERFFRKPLPPSGRHPPGLLRITLKTARRVQLFRTNVWVRRWEGHPPAGKQLQSQISLQGGISAPS